MSFFTNLIAVNGDIKCGNIMFSKISFVVLNSLFAIIQ